MKAIVYFISIFFSLSVIAQNDNSSLFKTLILKPGISHQHWGKAKLISSTVLGKVYALPVDNMPCLSSNLKGITKIPNAASYPIISGLRNSFKKEEILPQENAKDLAFNNSLLFIQLHKRNFNNNFILSK